MSTRGGRPRRRERSFVTAAALVALVALAGCGSDRPSETRQTTGAASSAPATPSATPPGSASPSASGSAPVRGLPPSQLSIGTTRLADGLGRVTAIAAPDDGSNRLLVADKSGIIRVYRVGQGVVSGNYLDIRDQVSTDGNERGLLGIAVSPDFATTRTLVVAYTRSSDNAVTLARFRLGSAGQASVPAGSGQVALTQSHDRFGNHNGGQITFGPDRMLYWGVGDGGGGGDPLTSGQNLNTLLGKILRVDVLRDCDGRPYCVPADNPFVGRSGARPEIWAYGLRNPWRFSFDRADRTLWIGDVGQNSLEEIDHLPAGRGGVNLGWSCREGTEVFNESRCADGATYTGPVFTYRTGEDGCAVQGGFVYRGIRFAALAGGTYVMADYCSSNAWGIAPNGSSVAVDRIGKVPGQPTTFGQDQAGELYLGTDSGELHSVTFRRR